MSNLTANLLFILQFPFRTHLVNDLSINHLTQPARQTPLEEYIKLMWTDSQTEIQSEMGFLLKELIFKLEPRND